MQSGVFLPGNGPQQKKKGGARRAPPERLATLKTFPLRRAKLTWFRTLKTFALRSQFERTGPHSRNQSCDTLRAMHGESNFASFWPEYVRAHSQLGTRAIHLAGTLFGWALFIAAIALRQWWWVAAALIASYALAWISHFFVEHNRPATFEHPLWSWRADQKMVALMLAGKMSDEVRRCTAAQN